MSKKFATQSTKTKQAANENQGKSNLYLYSRKVAPPSGLS